MQTSFTKTAFSLFIAVSFRNYMSLIIYILVSFRNSCLSFNFVLKFIAIQLLSILHCKKRYKKSSLKGSQKSVLRFISQYYSQLPYVSRKLSTLSSVISLGVIFTSFSSVAPSIRSTAIDTARAPM